MSTRKHITFSDTTAEILDKIPKAERSGFVENAVAKALRLRAKITALKMLDEADKISNEGKSIVETLRDIREQESSTLSPKH
jgi:hypothetical protein